MTPGPTPFRPPRAAPPPGGRPPAGLLRLRWRHGLLVPAAMLAAAAAVALPLAPGGLAAAAGPMAAVGAAGALFGLWLARGIARPIEALVAATRAIADGAPAALSAELAARRDELGDLARALDAMAAELARRTVSRAYLQDILSSMLDGLVVVTPAGRIEMVNAAACRLTGWTEAELVGGPAGRIIPGGPPPAEGRGDPARHGVDRVLARDGRAVPALVSLSVMRGGGGDARIVCVFRDIAEIRRREEELRAARDGADAASRAKSEFLANMSHELRTPLNAIIGFAEVMRDEVLGPLDPRYRGYCADIHDSGQHLLAIINDILDLSKIEAGGLAPEAAPTDVAAAVEAVLRLMAVRAAAEDVRLEMAVPDCLPPLLADPRMLRQILLNLVGNGVKFNRPGGRVSVRAWIASDGGLGLAVADTGIGMRPEDVPRALTPFVQVDGSIGRRFPGTGLGLPLAQAMMRLHGGTLAIDSRPGLGTDVALRFPPERLGGAAPARADAG
ncbi:MAG TPA: ATP-binding protein [Alphaproteobacteria bacterium]|nr:ATP-binding protein [Alphaproteobacteria bacterium]